MSGDSPLAAEAAAPSAEVAVPREPLGRLFLRFLRFGALAWGGPVVQIAMLRQSLVDEERWVTPQHFNRVLALYQVLPGPEAHELCVYFGMLSRGRVGGVLAGFGFMLPGFVLMFLLSWLYVRAGFSTSAEWAMVFAAVQAAVAGVIVRAVHRIGSHVINSGWLWAVALLAAAAQLLGVHFGLTLVAGGLLYVLAQQRRTAVAFCLAGASAIALVAVAVYGGFDQVLDLGTSVAAATTAQEPSLARLFWAGLKAGSLTFGGAYTVIPFLQEDAVATGAWMSNEQFLDGVALGGLLPAPLIIFATFVGYLGGGAAGALVLTVGIFLPAFVLTLVGHGPMERLLEQARLRAFLDGVTAAVVGLIAGTTVALMAASIINVTTAIVFLCAVAAAFWIRSKYAVPLIVAAAIGWGFVARVVV
jgi:chromate transporter